MQKTIDIKTEKPISKTIQTKSGQTILEKINGIIPANLYKKGQKIDVMTLGPDGKIQTQQIATNKGKFEYPFRISDNTIPGKYEITISYLGKSLKKLLYEVV